MFFIKKYKKELYDQKLMLSRLRFNINELKKELNDLKLNIKQKDSEYIIHYGLKYKKVSRKAQHGDFVVVRSMTSESSYVEINKPYKVFCNYKGTPFIERDYLAAVYHEAFGRTRDTVDVYELVDND